MAELAAAGVIPLMFGFTDLIEGRGFVARIRTNGRAVVEEDDESTWWVNGVNPGGVCAPGASAQEALKAFRLTYTEVLLDCAMRCKTFGTFQSEIELIFNSTTKDIMDEWRAAALVLREGAEAGPLEDLERLPYDNREYAVTVEEIVIQYAEPQHDGEPVYAQAA
jgi:hypothetical protein